MIQENNILCIYHGNCADGFGAAWSVWKRFPNAIFYAGVYGELPPDCSNKDVFLVDFSYNLDVLEQISNVARSVIILDHHKTAVENITLSKKIGGHHPIDASKRCANFEDYNLQVYQDQCEGVRCPVYYLFDMNRSGAMITWDFFHTGKESPRLIKHIQDRDLWQFKLDFTREIQSNLFSYPYDFEVWDNLMFRLEDQDEYLSFRLSGKAIERKHLKDVEELVGVTKRAMNIGGHIVWCANIPYTMASDACHLMCQQPMSLAGEECLPVFSACYYDKTDCRVFSLRSIGDFDVSKIAKIYGGGGHKNASGFSTHLGWYGEINNSLSTTINEVK